MPQAAVPFSPYLILFLALSPHIRFPTSPTCTTIRALWGASLHACCKCTGSSRTRACVTPPSSPCRWTRLPTLRVSGDEMHSTAWAGLARDGYGCERERCARVGPLHCCAVNACRERFPHPSPFLPIRMHAGESHAAICVSYDEPKTGSINDEFFGLVKLSGWTGSKLFSALSGAFSQRNVDLAGKLSSFSGDGCAAIASEKKGVFGHLRREVNSVCFGVHCTSHRFALALKDVASHKNTSATLKSVLKGVDACIRGAHSLFSKSAKRVEEFKALAATYAALVKKPKIFVTSRWSSRYNCIRDAVPQLGLFLDYVGKNVSGTKPATAQPVAAQPATNNNTRPAAPPPAAAAATTIRTVQPQALTTAIPVVHPPAVATAAHRARQQHVTSPAAFNLTNPAALLQLMANQAAPAGQYGLAQQQLLQEQLVRQQLLYQQQQLLLQQQHQHQLQLLQQRAAQQQHQALPQQLPMPPPPPAPRPPPAPPVPNGDDSDEDYEPSEVPSDDDYISEDEYESDYDERDTAAEGKKFKEVYTNTMQYYTLAFFHFMCDALAQTDAVFKLMQVEQFKFSDVPRTLESVRISLQNAFVKVNPGAYFTPALKAFFVAMRESGFTSYKGHKLTEVPTNESASISVHRLFVEFVEQLLSHVSRRFPDAPFLAALALFDPVEYPADIKEVAAWAAPHWDAITEYFKKHAPSGWQGVDVDAAFVQWASRAVEWMHGKRESAIKNREKFIRFYVKQRELLASLLSEGIQFAGDEPTGAEAVEELSRSKCERPKHHLNILLREIHTGLGSTCDAFIKLMIFCTLIKPTSVMCERVFSLRTVVKTNRRARLSPIRLAECLFLKFNTSGNLFTEQGVLQAAMTRYKAKTDMQLYTDTASKVENQLCKPQFSRVQRSVV